VRDLLNSLALTRLSLNWNFLHRKVACCRCQAPILIVLQGLAEFLPLAAFLCPASPYLSEEKDNPTRLADLGSSLKYLLSRKGYHKDAHPAH
jgi:hypothetical protein